MEISFVRVSDQDGLCHGEQDFLVDGEVLEEPEASKHFKLN